MSVDNFAEISVFDDDEASLVASESSDCDTTDPALSHVDRSISRTANATAAANIDETAASGDFESAWRDFDAWFNARAAAHAARLELAELELQRRLRAHAANNTHQNTHRTAVSAAPHSSIPGMGFVAVANGDLQLV